MVVATGTPEEIAQQEDSHTGRFLRSALRDRSSVSYADIARDEEASALVAEESTSSTDNTPPSASTAHANTT
jgi:hypothetical protein